jgi:protoporphyrinogen oxidase
LPRGSQQISEGLCRFITEQGGIIRTRATVRKIVLEKQGRVKKVIFLQEERQEEAEGDYVVNTLPLTEFIQSVEPVPYPTLQAARSLRFRHLWLFYFIISRPFLTDKVQIYFPEKQYLFKRVYEAHPINGASCDRTAICVEVCYNDGDSISQMSEEELSFLLQKQLAQFYGLQSNELIAAFSRRAPFAYAVYKKGYRKYLFTIASFLFDIDSLTSYGRSGLFRYNFLTDRIIDAAKTVLQYIMAEQTKKHFLKKVQPKGDFL